MARRKYIYEIKNCSLCYSQFEWIPWKSAGKFCSKECYRKHLSLNCTGENNNSSSPGARTKISEKKKEFYKNNPPLRKEKPAKIKKEKLIKPPKTKKIKLPKPEKIKKIPDNSKKSHSGPKNGMFGRCAFDIWVEKFGIEEALRRKEITKERQRISNKIARQNEILSKNKVPKINYNKNGIALIEQFGYHNGYNFIHAENGGEIRLLSYYVDGYDKENNVVIEIDEPGHFDKFGNYKEYDSVRQNRIMKHFKCDFIRIKYKTGEIIHFPYNSDDLEVFEYFNEPEEKVLNYLSTCNSPQSTTEIAIRVLGSKLESDILNSKRNNPLRIKTLAILKRLKIKNKLQCHRYSPLLWEIIQN